MTFFFLLFILTIPHNRLIFYVYLFCLMTLPSLYYPFFTFLSIFLVRIWPVECLTLFSPFIIIIMWNCFACTFSTITPTHYLCLAASGSCCSSIMRLCLILKVYHVVYDLLNIPSQQHSVRRSIHHTRIFTNCSNFESCQWWLLLAKLISIITDQSHLPNFLIPQHSQANCIFFICSVSQVLSIQVFLEEEGQIVFKG